MRALSIAVLVVCCALVSGVLPVRAQETAPSDEVDWSGRWNSFLPEGMVVVDLLQDGERVTGTYNPGGGRIEASLDGRMLTGAWIEPRAEGSFSLVLAEDGQSFAGSDDRGSYWTGGRIDAMPPPRPVADVRRAGGALRTILAALNSTEAGDATAALLWEPLLIYEGAQTTAADQRYRRQSLYRLLDMSTFRTEWVEVGDTGDRAEALIGPIDSSWRFELDLLRGEDGVWRLLVPPLNALTVTLAEALEATGYDNYHAFRADRSDGPRQAMQGFLDGIKAWHDGGDEVALERLDIAYLPPHLREVEGAILADYLRQVIDRVGYVIWQELPDDPTQDAPYVHFRHPVGTIEIVPVEAPLPEGAPLDAEPVRSWKFSRETMIALPGLYEATREMGIAQGLETPEPLSRFFRTRSWFEETRPALLQRWLGLELWQWLAGAAVLAAIAAAMGGIRILFAAVARLPGLGQAGLLAGPARLLASGALLLLLVHYAGLRADVAQVIDALAILALIGGATALVYQLVGPAVRGFQSILHRRGMSDDIVAALAIGLLRVAVVVTGAVVAAGQMGLPYEGVIAGLGVGGLAVAFAARDTVANLIGAAILLADRPFKKGDLIEAEGTMAVVEGVGLRSTRLRTLDDSLLIVPNSRLSDNTLNNWGRRRSRRLVLQIGLLYDTPREKLDIFTARLRQVYFDQPRADDPLYVGLSGFAESSIDVELWGYIRAPGYDEFVEAKHRLIGDIVEAAREVGVDFAFPTRTLHMVASGASGIVPVQALADEAANTA